jgi:hypothetical protein
MKRALIVVAKEPVPGQTKTRLCPPLTPEQAVELYRCFLLDTLDMMRRVDAVGLVVAYTPASAKDYFRQVAGSEFALIPQVGDSLGQRLDHALTQCLSAGYDEVAVMNSDGPTLPMAHLQQAFELLDDPHVDVVLGPSDDGGYYLIGTKRPVPRLLREVQMSTPHVLRDTLALAEEEGLHVALLPPWYDVDDLPSFLRLRAEVMERPDAAPHTGVYLSGGGPWPW